MSLSGLSCSRVRSFSRGPLVVAAMLLCTATVLTGCGKKGTELGGGSSEVTGSAGPVGAKGHGVAVESEHPRLLLASDKEPAMQ